jgi:predicted GIY-YIG superfamily endonuclease/predicted transport protein
MRPGCQRICIHVDSILKHIPAAEFGKIPNQCGAYVIHAGAGRRYVGSSNTVRSRVQAHKAPLDPNIKKEPIRSVCCYLAGEHMDARILEYWLIREIAPELNNSCPQGAGGQGDRCRERCERIGAPGRDIDIEAEVVRVLEDVPVHATGGLPDGPGAYVLRTRSGKRYVGVSKSLRDRVRAHIDNPMDPNVREPARSVSVFETRTEADALILEYALIRDLRPELNRENQPDASEWKTGSREALFTGADPKLRELQADLGRRILTQIGGKEVVRRSWITYQLSPMKNFCAVKVLADCLQVDLKVGKAFQDPGGISEELARTQAWTFDRRLRIKTQADLDAAIPLIAQAFRAQGG